MTRARHFLYPVFLFILLALTSGCATGPQQQGGQSSTLSRSMQKALNAMDTNNYEQATRYFDKTLKKEEEIQDEYRYDYGLALSKTGRYQEAIAQISLYIESLEGHNDDFYKALSKREIAEQKLQLQQKEAEKVRLVEQTHSRIAVTTSENWLVVKQQRQTHVATFIEPLTNMEMIRVTGGCYMMGDQFGDGETDERPVHEVCIDDFYLGRYEVTIEQWLQVMGYNPSEFEHAGLYPVDSISWQEATAFAEALSGDNGNYRLPTEAEWEYAARSGGQKQKFSGGDNLDEVAWYEDNAGDGPHPVGQKQPNGLGLHDMSGNLYEWCLDRYAADYYQQSPVQNPGGAVSGTERTRRGGSWSSEILYNRTGYRTEKNQANHRHWNTGFRLALPAPQ